VPKKSRIFVADGISTGVMQFVGSRQLADIEAEILQIIPSEAATFIVFDRTSLYGEMGGEVGDSGTVL
jgi:alanyl-tRNA synthetase